MPRKVPTIDVRKLSRRLNRFSARLNDKRRHLVWRLCNRGSSGAIPVFVFGAQRSGTSMLGECLGRSPGVENMGEVDTRAFSDFFLLDMDTIDQLLANSLYGVIVFKPLKDSHRVAELLSIHPQARAVWAYRNYADRINSAVAKFGRHPLDVFDNYKSGRETAWQLADISAENSQLIEETDTARMTESDGAALMWYIRNSLFFDQGLQNDERVLLWSYDDFVTRPGNEMQSVAGFLDIPYRNYLVSAVHSSSVGKDSRPTIDPRIDKLCSEMLNRLDAARGRRS